MGKESGQKLGVKMVQKGNKIQHADNDPDLRLSIDFYISSLDHTQSQRAYSKAQSIVQRTFPNSNMLSYDQVKRRVSDLSGIVTWKHDMCFHSCVGFTGPYANLETCPDRRCL